MDRPELLVNVARALRRSPVVALVGARQVGKTTLARSIARGKNATWFDLEDAMDLARLEHPMLALGPLRGLVVIDEIQRLPGLFPTLRVLVDRGPKSRRFLVLGSAAGDLLGQTSESLTGRVAYIELSPFSIAEAANSERLWLRGGYPRAFLEKSDRQAFAWLRDYLSTFLERDVPSLGLRISAPALRRFWMMLAHTHGQTLNASELGRSLELSDKTVRHYVDVLAQAFMVRQLLPWHENLSKRQVKAPKIYVKDSGLLHELLSIHTRRALDVHPKLGASWEGFALENVIRALQLRTEECFFWATHADAELDLLTFIGGKRFGFEFKRTAAPKVTRSMRIAMADLGLTHLYVVIPGCARFPLDHAITAIGLDIVSAAAIRKRA
ncbi:MAG: ATP-binding protein [Myxococcales bacterium]|nr:ATP-binding protein [Myxococcales bacterium]